MKVVGYTRNFSCNLLEEISENIISLQNEQVAKYAAKRKWRVAKIYSDKKLNKAEDAAFISLKEDGISQKFDLVIFYSLYYFGTSVYRAYDVLYKTFYPGGIDFASVEDDFCSIDHSENEVKEFLFSKREEYKRLYQKQMLRHSAESRRYNKYGYRYIEKTMELEIDENAAKNVKTVFFLALKGQTPRQIAKYLNDQGTEPPNIYLKRMGTSLGESGREGWNEAQVSNILSKRMYTGALSRTVNNQKVTVSCPAIVTKEDFEKVQAISKSRRRGTKQKSEMRENPLCRNFFDYDSGLSILRYKSHKKGKDICRFNYKMQNIPSYPKMSIPYNFVICEIKRLLYKERERAQAARKILSTPECMEYKRERLKEICNKAKEVFAKMTEDYFKAWREGVKVSDDEYGKNDSELSSLLAKYKELDLALSQNNPWISLYADLELSSELTRREVQKYIIRASCEKFEKVRIEIKEREAFLALPQEWFAQV